MTQDYMVSINNMSKIEKPVKGEDGEWTVTIEMGVEVKELDEFLRKHDPPLALASNVMPTDVSFFRSFLCVFACRFINLFKWLLQGKTLSTPSSFILSNYPLLFGL